MTEEQVAASLPMVREYFSRIAQCKTVNQLNAVHIGLCNLMTPREALLVQRRLGDPAWEFPAGQVGKDTARAFRTALQDHMARMVGDLSYCGKTVAEPFARERVAHGAWRFSDGGERRQKSLLIAFTGNADRLMMPSPTYLQHFDAARVDIVFLVDRNKRRYVDGIAEIGASLEAVVDALPDLLGTTGYRRLAVTGTSSGALPAVLAGLRLRAASVLAFGGDNPEAQPWSAEGAVQRLAAASAASPDTQVRLAFGAQKATDREAAEATARAIEAELVPVTHPTDPVNHNAAYPLVTQGLFRQFVADHLGL